MLPVVTSEEMRAADRRAIDGGVPGELLMENAGAAVARAIRERWSRRRVTILCGKGNNGGDGFVVGRRLADWRPRVVLFAPREGVAGDAATHAQRLEASGVPIRTAPTLEAWAAARAEALDTEVVVDALLGTGLREGVVGVLAAAIEDVNRWAKERDRFVVAVDIPSGVSSDGGAPGAAVAASLTVTFAAPKVGHVLAPGCRYVGELVVADIGIPASALVPAAPGLFLIEPQDAASAWPARDAGSHKGRFGHLLVIAGSLGKAGAAVLAGHAALRSGAGLVTVATPACAIAHVAVGRPELMTEPLRDDGDRGVAESAVDAALSLAAERDAVALGPGLGQAPSTQAFVRRFLAACTKPVAVDADGLNALGSIAAGACGAGCAPRVLTPHPGEASRLLGVPAAEIQARRVEAARRLAQSSGAHCVLKGERSLVAEPAGRCAVNPTGNPGLATAGTGDVLSGMIGALLARGCDAWTAATCATYVHGMAGDVAARRLGEEAMIATDVIEAIGGALLGIRGERR